MIDAKVIVCVGSGGVGKTTVASSIAFLAAQQGKNVLVLTVDPAKRLKSTMGLDNDQDTSEIKHPLLKGTLRASVIDAKKTFDEFVMRASTNPESTKKILNNKLYVQLSTTLSGSQEFTALEKLYSSYESGLYDLIVLDTPPTKHAIDFLEAPQKLSAVFNDNVTKWFRDPEGKQQNFLVNILQVGTRQVLKALESITGSEFMRELAEFFKNIEQWQHKLEERTTEVHRLLVNAKTHFVLVTSFDEAKLQEGEFFSKEIKKAGYQLSAVIINRAYPAGINLEATVPEGSELGSLYRKFQQYYIKKQNVFKNFAIRMRSQGVIFQLPEMRQDISDLEGVVKMAEILKQQQERK